MRIATLRRAGLGRAGALRLLALALCCMPDMTRAGCPVRVSQSLDCSESSASIVGCSNQSSQDYQEIADLPQSLAKWPDQPEGRESLLHDAKTDLAPSILLLGKATEYDSLPVKCEADERRIERCELDLSTARKGLEILTRPEAVQGLSAETRDRLKAAFLQHADDYTAKLDRIAASGKGDPSDLCTKVYASRAACEKAIARDDAAVRTRVFPVYQCGGIVPGKFVTEQDARDDAAHENDPEDE